MYGMRETLINEKKYLESVMKKIDRQTDNILDESLRVSVDKGHVRYYRCTPDNRIGKYIKSKDIKDAQKLAQKEYNKKIYQLAKKRVGQISRLLNDYEDDEIENCFYNEHYGKRALIKPVEPLWEDKVNSWLDDEYEGKRFNEDTIEIYTQKGERVRSKSEKILADYFNYHRIPYKYEHPLKLKEFGIVYPDFTLLSKKTGREIYWEHNGMMDNPIYAQKAVKKINAYERNGIFVGDRLILTFETEQTALSTDVLEKMIERYQIVQVK